MRIFLILMITYIFSNTSVAQNISVFNSGFETDLLDDWTDTSQGNGLLEFNISSLAKFRGNNGFYLSFNESAQKGNLFSKKNINWEAGQTYKLSFFYKGIVPITSFVSNVKFFNNSNVKIGQVNFSLTSSSWTEYSLEFTPEESDNNGYFLISLRPNTNGSGEIYLDEVMLEKVVDMTNFYLDLKTKDVVSNQEFNWQQYGPGMSGNNTSFYIHPTDPNTHYTSPNMGNSYVSYDKGITYETIMNEDASYYKSGERGPREAYSFDFSRSNENIGFSTGKIKGAFYKSIDKGKKWTKVTTLPSNATNAFLACVTVDPKNDNIWYLGAGRMRDYGRLKFPLSQPNGSLIDSKSQNKIWKSLDGGVSWSLINTGLHVNAEVETILVDPIDSNIVYAATNYGFYKSTNGGSSWVLKSSGIDNNVIRSFVLYHNKDLSGDEVVLYVISNVTWKADGDTVTNDKGGVFKSTDKGETWTNISNDLSLNLAYFTENSGVKKSYYLNVAHYFGLSYTDAIAQYPILPNNLTQRFNQIEVDPNDKNNLYLVNNYSNASVNNCKPGQIWRTKNGGSHWYVTLRNGKNWNNGNDDSFWLSRNNPMGTNVAFKYKSDWYNRDDYERKGCNFIKFNADGSVLYTQMAKIGFVSYDKGDTWVDIDDVQTSVDTESWVGAGNSNVPGHGFYQSMLIENKVFCHTGENSLWITNNEGEQVRESAQAISVLKLTQGEHSVSNVVVHPTDPTIWYATFFRQDKRGQFLKSTDSGQTWNSIGTPIPQPWEEPVGGGDQAVHQMNILIDKANPNNIYFCVPKSTLDIEFVGDSVNDWGVHKSTNGGVTWTKINNGLPTSLDVARIAFDPNDSNILYAAVINSNGGLYKSVDAGLNWLEVSSTSAISGNLGINDIHFDIDGNAYITAGYKHENSEKGGLWKSTDNMQTWTEIFKYPWVNRVEVAKYDVNTILISTLPNSNVNYKNAGSYLSKDGGLSWIKINKGNGQADRINDIAIDYHRPGRYYVSTRGSGFYRTIDKSVDDSNLSNSENIDYPQVNKVKIYPNPSSGLINIKNIDNIKSIVVYDVMGNKVKMLKPTKIVDLTNLNSGVYLMVFKNGNQYQSQKIVIK